MVKIKSLRIANFRSYASNTTFTLAARTYFVGHNNAGKSTAIDALEWALRGKCRGLESGTAREIVELIREGHGGAAAQPGGLGVKIEIEGFGSVQRQTDGREVFLKVKDWSGSNKAQQEQMFEQLRITDAVIEACLNSETFLRLHHADAKNLVMGVLDVRIPAAELEPLGIAGPLSLEELERHYKRQFEKRTDAKRDLETHVVFPAPAPLDELQEGEVPPPIAELQEALEEVRDQERDLLTVGAETRGRRVELLKQIGALGEEKNALQKRIATYGDDPHGHLDRLEERLRMLPGPAPPQEFTPPAPPAADPAEAAEQVELVELRTRLVDEGGRLKMIRASVDRIEAHDPAKGCVIDGSIPCLTPAKEFRGKLKTIRGDIRALETSIGEATARQDFLEGIANTRATERAEAAAAARRSAKQAFDATIEENRRAREAVEQLRREVQTAKAKVDHHQADTTRLEEVLAQLSRAETELANLGDPGEVPEGLDAVRERIARGEKLIERVRAWQQSQDQHVASLDAQRKYLERVERLEHVVERLGPKGLIVDVLDAARRTFEDKANAALERFGYHLAFTIDPWTVRVNGRKSTQLSFSERLRVGVALQLAIAEITGFGLVAIDAVDTLDSRNREILGDVIDGWPGQVILAATKDPDYQLPEDLPDDVAFYKLELRDGLTHVYA